MNPRISPVTATVILIAITLIAAIAIAGFVFGLFGNFTGGGYGVYECVQKGLNTFIVNGTHTQTIQAHAITMTTIGYGCP